MGLLQWIWGSVFIGSVALLHQMWNKHRLYTLKERLATLDDLY